MTIKWIGMVLQRYSKTGALLSAARIVHIEMQTATVFMMPFPKTRKSGIDNYVPSVKIASATELAAELKSSDQVKLVSFDAPSHWLWTDTQLRGEVGDGSGLRTRRKLSKWVMRMEAGFELIKPFVDGRQISEIVMDSELPSWPAKRAKELNQSHVKVRRYLNLYLFGMGNKRALLPWYSHCGAPGKQKFSLTDTGRPSISAIQLGSKRVKPSLSADSRKKLAMGYRRFMKGGVSVQVALTKTLIQYFPKSISLTGKESRIEFQPEAHDITKGMFQYWGTRSVDAIFPKGYARGEVINRNELQRRMHKVKGRHETLNATAYIDSTSCDQTLISSIHPLKVLKSPWRTEILGASIDYIFGIYVGVEPVSATTALLAILHAATDKIAFCARFGHDIELRDWYPCTFNNFVMDNGEGKGTVVQQTLQELETTSSYGKVYDAINKASAESGHSKRQARVDHLLPGSTQGRARKRGERSLAAMAGLRFDDYMYLLIKEILYHNNVCHIDPPRIEMYPGLRERTRRGVVEWMMEHHYVSSAPSDLSILRVSCLPRFKAVVHGDGVHLFFPGSGSERLIPDLVYRSEYMLNEGHLHRARQKPFRTQIHLDPMQIDQAWINLDGLKKIDLISNDDDLKNLSLLEWLAICEDNKLAAWLAKRVEGQHIADKLVTAQHLYAEGVKSRREVEEALGKPNKKSLRSDIRTVTSYERAVLTGVPPDFSQLPVIQSRDCKREDAPHSPARATQRGIEEQWLELAAEIYEAGVPV